MTLVRDTSDVSAVRLFADQKGLGPDDLKQHAKDLQLDLKRFEADMRDPERRRGAIPTSPKQVRSVLREHPAFLSMAGSSPERSHS